MQGEQYDHVYLRSKKYWGELVTVFEAPMRYGFKKCNNYCQKLEVYQDAYVVYKIVLFSPVAAKMKDRQGQSVREHEWAHFRIEESYWENIDMVVHAFVSGSCVPDSCAVAISDYLAAQEVALFTYRFYKHFQLDCLGKGHRCKEAVGFYTLYSLSSSHASDLLAIVATKCGK